MASFVKTTTICKMCGEHFEREFGAKRKYCNPACVRAAHNKKQNERYAAKHPVMKKKCGYCEKTYVSSRKGQRYCSDDCFTTMRRIRQHAAREKRKEFAVPEGQTKSDRDEFAKALLKRIGKLPSAIDRMYGANGGYHVSV